METKHIQLHDLANVLNLIDAAAKNGMVSGEAMTHMGAMRDRFMAELKEQAPAQDNVATLRYDPNRESHCKDRSA
jgi:hypothetical protein